jgi:hypothetical protein
MTFDLEAKEVEAKVLTTLASIAGSTGGRSGGGWPERGEFQEAYATLRRYAVVGPLGNQPLTGRRTVFRPLLEIARTRTHTENTHRQQPSVLCNASLDFHFPRPPCFPNRTTGH